MFAFWFGIDQRPARIFDKKAPFRIVLQNVFYKKIFFY